MKNKINTMIEEAALQKTGKMPTAKSSELSCSGTVTKNPSQQKIREPQPPKTQSALPLKTAISSIKQIQAKDEFELFRETWCVNLPPQSTIETKVRRHLQRPKTTQSCIKDMKCLPSSAWKRTVKYDKETQKWSAFKPS